MSKNAERHFDDLKLYDEDDYLMLSGIQHFTFCKRQWALIHIENQWVENPLTANGQIIHERVHDPSNADKRGDILTVRGLAVSSHRLKISGECDAVEFIPDTNGVPLYGRDGTWKVRPIEYKHGSSKVSDCDRLQVTLQALCLEEMLCCHIDEACLFYHETRHRETVELTDEYRQAAEKTVAEMRSYYQRKYTPRVKPHKGCKNCSLAGLCLPDLMKGRPDTVFDYVKAHVQEETL